MSLLLISLAQQRPFCGLLQLVAFLNVVAGVLHLTWAVAQHSETMSPIGKTNQFLLVLVRNGLVERFNVSKAILQLSLDHALLTFSVLRSLPKDLFMRVSTTLTSRLLALSNQEISARAMRV